VRLLLTRPEPDAERTAATLRERGHEVVIASLLRTEFLPEARIGAGPWAAVLITSANAARPAAAHPRFAEWRTAPVFAVGARSAKALHAAGFTDVSSADGNVGDLANLVALRLAPSAKLLYLAGGDRSGDLAGDLAARGFEVETAVVYRAVATHSFPPAAVEVIGGALAGVLHFSRRSAALYVDLARRAGLLARALEPLQFCLSAQVAEPLLAAGAATVRIASKPTETALVELIGPAGPS
jgi:uroporphyrinogen-III synthase